MTRWIFHDTVTDEVWTVPINPDSMTSPEPKRALSPVPGHPKNLLRPRALRTASDPTPWSFSGAIRTQTHLDTLNQWASREVAVDITDHIDRTYRVYIEKFTPVQRRTHNTYGTLTSHWRYTVDTTILERLA